MIFPMQASAHPSTGVYPVGEARRQLFKIDRSIEITINLKPAAVATENAFRQLPFLLDRTAVRAGPEEIIVYFDNSIYGLLERRYGVKVLRDQLESFLKGCGATKVIVARPGEQADEQLLRDGEKSFSAEPCSTVIFSRDKFTDWPEYAEMIERIVIPVWFDGPPMSRTIRSPGLVNMLALMEGKIPPCEITSVDWTNARQSA